VNLLAKIIDGRHGTTTLDETDASRFSVWQHSSAVNEFLHEVVQ
jgi:hypothetical protein